MGFAEEIEVCRFRVRIERVRVAALQFEGCVMPGEIRAKMAELRKAKQAMVAGLQQEIDGVIKEVAATHADGLEAMKLPRAELEATRQEIREIRAEFAPASNGGPAGPLPDAPAPSPEPSAGSASDAALQQPQASWKAAT